MPSERGLLQGLRCIEHFAEPGCEKWTSMDKVLGESESGPAELLRLRRLIASTSSGRKGVSRMLNPARTAHAQIYAVAREELML